MELEVVPAQEVDDRTRRAIAGALAQAGLSNGLPSASSTGAWHRAGLHDAVDRETTPERSSATWVGSGATRVEAGLFGTGTGLGATGAGSGPPAQVLPARSSVGAALA